MKEGGDSANHRFRAELSTGDLIIDVSAESALGMQIHSSANTDDLFFFHQSGKALVTKAHCLGL